MAQFAATSASNVGAPGPVEDMARPGGDPRRRVGSGVPAAEPSRNEIQMILGQFDAKINQMMDYPAKDVINSLTKLAERIEYAPEIVSFLETKIHRAPPNYKLPIFYLTDSILKNVRGPYPGILGRNIVPLYCNCVKLVSGKDLRRFLHVLNTWDQTRLFPKEALAQMRTAVDRALEAADPSAKAQPVSFSQEPPPPQHRPAPAQLQQDMELRSLLTQMQNDMGIHPTAHLTLEQVRVQNPEWYKQLVDFHAASKQEPTQQPPAPQPYESGSPHGGLLPPPGAVHQPVARPSAREPRRSRFSERSAGPNQPPARRQPPQNHHQDRSPQQTQSQSANVSHLMDLLKRKKKSPSPPPQHRELMAAETITNEQSRTPNAAAVMSILQKLKGLNGNATQPPLSQSQPTMQPPAGASSEASASKMWFSDKIVAHKDRVESNVQKLYAALPLVCRESGLRFKEQDKLNAHLDFLFQYNRSQKERGKGGVSRSWYPDEDQWVTDFSGEGAPRETTSSSFFDQKDAEEEVEVEYDSARVPVDDAVTRCRICGENFVKSWDEEEEDWMYTNAVYGTIHDPSATAPEQKTIFHKYCYDTVMANSKHITPEHLIPGTPQALKAPVAAFPDDGDSTNVKRPLEEAESDSDDNDDDVKRIKTD